MPEAPTKSIQILGTEVRIRTTNKPGTPSYWTSIQARHAVIGPHVVFGSYADGNSPENAEQMLAEAITKAVESGQSFTKLGMTAIIANETQREFMLSDTSPSDNAQQAPTE